MALVKDCNAPQKHVWRAKIILLSDDGVDTVDVMPQTGKERFASEGFDGLLHDKTRPSRIPSLEPEVAERMVALTVQDPPGETTYWAADMMAQAAGISASAVRRELWRKMGDESLKGLRIEAGD
ncbi:hypothetical protein [Mesorhizobium silamurunense]|uniref:hypothetical protein n=1 Tax=Mesorhizobium silamurunense TaxID=499528 RepID=UPI0035E44931